MPCDARGAQVGEGHRGGVENGVVGWLAACLLLCSRVFDSRPHA
jgi:hypothetical protein